MSADLHRVVQDAANTDEFWSQLSKQDQVTGPAHDTAFSTRTLAAVSEMIATNIGRYILPKDATVSSTVKSKVSKSGCDETSVPQIRVVPKVFVGFEENGTNVCIGRMR